MYCLCTYVITPAIPSLMAGLAWPAAAAMSDAAPVFEAAAASLLEMDSCTSSRISCSGQSVNKEIKETCGGFRCNRRNLLERCMDLIKCSVTSIPNSTSRNHWILLQTQEFLDFPHFDHFDPKIQVFFVFFLFSSFKDVEWKE